MRHLHLFPFVCTVCCPSCFPSGKQLEGETQCGRGVPSSVPDEGFPPSHSRGTFSLRGPIFNSFIGGFPAAGETPPSFFTLCVGGDDEQEGERESRKQGG